MCAPGSSPRRRRRHSKSHNVATATASHKRAARWGAVIRVRCHCQPARLVTLKPCSIQARRPYQHASLVVGGRAVRMNQGAVSPSSQQASKVHARRRGARLKAVPVPRQRRPG